MSIKALMMKIERENNYQLHAIQICKKNKDELGQAYKEGVIWANERILNDLKQLNEVKSREGEVCRCLKRRKLNEYVEKWICDECGKLHNRQTEGIEP
jgi:rubrerythrin